ncbi:MAG: hypothetical protein KDE22_17300 [Rhodobacterales bacterium]|nr:hypothetical protein [Rhodobacterales bacterium]
MKITVDVDCTPDEARTFLGLPDVKPLQEAMMKEVEARMRANLSAMDPEALFRTWLPAGVKSLEQIQKLFWTQMTGAARKADKDDNKSDNKK